MLAGLLITPASAGSATAMITPGGGCSATVRVDAQWGTGPAGGQVLHVTVANTSAAPATDWTVSWSLGAGQTVRSSWNAKVTTSAGTLTAVNTAYNGKLAPGATTTFGLQLAGVAAPPTLSCDNGGGTPPADVTVGDGADGGSVTLRVGQTLAVSLGSDYLPPSVSGSALSRLSSTGGFPTGSPLTALYRGSAIGEVDLSTRTGTGTGDVTWSVRVTVLGPSSTGGGQSHTVTTADNQRTLNLTVGDILVVNLPGNYVPPTVTPAGVLTLGEISGGYPTLQPLVVRYVAATPGTADVTTYTDIACNHEPTPCPSPSVPWTLHLIVS
jgi:hypothetical protein